MVEIPNIMDNQHINNFTFYQPNERSSSLNANGNRGNSLDKNGMRANSLERNSKLPRAFYSKLSPENIYLPEQTKERKIVSTKRPFRRQYRK